MKTLSTDNKIRIIDQVVEPLIGRLSPDVIASCIASTLKVYLNSPDFNSDEAEIKASVVLSTGLTMDFLNQLMIWYED